MYARGQLLSYHRPVGGVAKQLKQRLSKKRIASDVGARFYNQWE